MSADRLFALVDGNNFYVSCERVFRPSLCCRPVVVMSNNDGCAISRSEEAKLLGIGMGEPVFKYRALIERHGVELCSANFTLYGDMSTRVNETLRTFAPGIEMYSIDESFVDLSGMADRDLKGYGREMRERVRRWTGIPVCVGIGPTKALAKLGNAVAKKNKLFAGVCDLMDRRFREQVLRLFPVGDVWGVGRAKRRQLTALGIDTAARLAELPLGQARALGTVVLERLVRELNGESCLEMETVPAARKSAAVTRSFGQPVNSFAELMESVAQHVARVGEKLRQQDLVAGEMTVFTHTSSFRGGPQRCGTGARRISPATSDTRLLLKVARRCAEKAYRGGYRYIKSGVIVDDLRPRPAGQPTLFGWGEEGSIVLMKAVDDINRRYGADTVFPASRGTARSWKMRQLRLSPRYTTRIGDVPVVRA